MKHDWNDMERFSQQVAGSKRVMSTLLKFGRRLMEARQAGVIYGSDATGRRYLRPSQWDRGVVHRFDGRGAMGLILRWLGPAYMRWKSMSPIPLYREDGQGRRVETPGVITHVIRKHRDYYQRGIKILIIHPIDVKNTDGESELELPVYSYNGEHFDRLHHVRVNMDIVNQFKAKNFLSAYIPDYGAIVFNTINPVLLDSTTGSESSELQHRLNILIQAIEIASLYALGRASGQSASEIIQRKEAQLRQAWARVKAKTGEVNEKKRYLRALGGISAGQVHMAPVSTDEGVFGFMDMVGSVGILSAMPPEEYFHVLTLCHEIAAETALKFGCRLDNFLGDGVFLEHVSVFDSPDSPGEFCLEDRLVAMTMALGSIFAGIHALTRGAHPIDPSAKVKHLLERYGVELRLRAGMDYGRATVGPLGSRQRRIITAIGPAVNTASRLEHTGRPGCIHVEARVVERLKMALVRQDAPWLELAHGKRDFPWMKNPTASILFFDLFRQWFGLGGEVILPHESVAYKEFVREKTYFIRCLSDSILSSHDNESMNSVA